MIAGAPAESPTFASRLRRVPAYVYVAFIIVLAVVIGIIAGVLFARHQIDAAPHVARAIPGEFAPPPPRPVGVPSTPVPIPTVSAAMAIGFLDEQRNVAVPAEVVRAKVGDCVVARVQPKRGSAYQRLLGGERWSAAGHPTLTVRPGDAPGFCFSWDRPSGKKGYALDASAVIANDAGERALGSGAARVIVQGTPKPEKSATSLIIKHGRAKPQSQPTPNDQ